MRVLKICTGIWKNDSRDERELSVCRELGAETIVLAKGEISDRGRADCVDGFTVYRYTTRPYKKLPTSINKMLSVILWAKYVASLNADIISGHDIDAWSIGWLSRFYIRKKKPLLVYDSHEFELGRNIKRSRFIILAIKIWERIIIKHSAFTIVVNDSIADELVRVHNLSHRPVVVRNIPQKWNIRPEVCEERRRELLRMFGGGFILIYHGAICPNRGLENLLTAIQGTEDIKLLLLGNPQDNTYLEMLKQNYISKMDGIVAYRNAVPHDRLWEYLGAADLGVIPTIPKYRSYYLVLPNKLFESIQAGTPLLVSDLPEMKKIIETYRVGEVVAPGNPQLLRKKILEMKGKGKRFYLDGLKRANQELTWENEKHALLEAYSLILNS